MRILGVDPGTAYVGYGVIDTAVYPYRVISFGRIKVRSTTAFSEKLRQIYNSISQLILETSSDVMAVENVFVSCNAKTSLKLGHARGVILLAAAQNNLPVYEYAPREIKQAILGQGNASKTQVQWMICQLLKLEENILEEDAADGLAVACCHGFKVRTFPK